MRRCSTPEPGQVNIQLPSQTGVGTAESMVSDGCGSSGPVAFNVAQAAPHIFQNAAGQATAVLNQDYSVNGPTNPAKTGSFVYCVPDGHWPGSNPPADGAAASLTKLSPTTLAWSATISGWSPPASPYQFLGLAPGMWGWIKPTSWCLPV